MKRLKQFVQLAGRELSKTILRFPLTIAFFLGNAVLACYAISLHSDIPLMTEKLDVTCLVWAILAAVCLFWHL